MKQKNSISIQAEAGKQEVFITRDFDAPRELVFKAFTDPELLVQWWGPREVTMKIDFVTYAKGGSYRYIHTNAQGGEFAFNGVIHEVIAPERIIQTFEFEGLPEKGHVCLETIRFESLPGGRTRTITQDIFQSVADRDGMMASGMEAGVEDSYNRLEELLGQPASR